MRLKTPIFRLKRAAKTLARAENIPLHQALNHAATAEGFASWSHLAAAHRAEAPAAALFRRMKPGELILFAARPGHGKTMLALELAVEAARAGWRSAFFTLEYTEAQTTDRLAEVAADAPRLVSVDASEGLTADRIVARAGGKRAFIVIDYLQVMDQRRSDPDLATQVRALHDFARDTGAIVIAISQIARRFEANGDRMPSVEDIRLPNPVDLSLFARRCFLHDGVVAMA